jgi:hypothetical protein
MRVGDVLILDPACRWKFTAARHGIAGGHHSVAFIEQMDKDRVGRIDERERSPVERQPRVAKRLH